MSQQRDPIRDLMVLQERMNRLFEEATERRAGGGAESRDEREHVDWTPAADVYEHEQEYLVTLDLPGIERSQLEIDLDSDRLSIRGARSIDGSPQHRGERPRGRFARTFGVPSSVDQEGIAAEYKDGVLSVRLPKRREQKGHRVQIKVS